MSEELELYDQDNDASHCPKCGELITTLGHYPFYVKRVVGRVATPELHCTKEVKGRV